MLFKGFRHFTLSIRSFSTHINASMVAQLRKLSGASIGLCREALTIEGGDIDKSIVWLRKKGIDTSSKRNSRDALCGVIAVNSTDRFVSAVELNCETDFVARNDSFINLAKDLAEGVNGISTTVGDLSALSLASGDASTAITNISAILGEKVSVRRALRVNKPFNGVLVYYQHQAQNDISQKVSIVALESPHPISSDIEENAKKLCRTFALQAVSAQPKFLSELPSSVIATETDIAISQADQKFEDKKNVGYQKFIEGHLNKMRKLECFDLQDFFFLEVLESQGISVSGKTVGEVLKSFNKKYHIDLKFQTVAVFTVGNGNTLVHVL